MNEKALNEEQPIIARRLDALNSVRQDVADRLFLLGEKLGPVLTPEYETVSETAGLAQDVPKPLLSAIAERLDTEIEGLARLSSTIRLLTDRVEL